MAEEIESLKAEVDGMKKVLKRDEDQGNKENKYTDYRAKLATLDL